MPAFREVLLRVQKNYQKLLPIDFKGSKGINLFRKQDQPTAMPSSSSMLKGLFEGGVKFAQVTLNKITGYDVCEALKNRVLEEDVNFARIKEKVNHSKATYQQAIQDRANCQRDLNTLLQRKHAWSEEDVTRFTQLYKDEIRFEALQNNEKVTNQTLENQLDASHSLLMNIMRERYQQEQLWSDKIRKISTFGRE